MIFRGSVGLVMITSKFKCCPVNRTLTTFNLPYVIKHGRFWHLLNIDATNKLNRCFIDNRKYNMIENGLFKYFSLSSVTSHNLKQLIKINTNTSLVVSACGVMQSQERKKSTKKFQKRAEYDSDSDSDEEDEHIQGSKIVTSRMQSLRLDGLLKKSLNVTRNKAETSFFEGRIRVNGKKPDKKAFQLRIGDEVDLINGLSPLNSEFVNVSRIEILSVNVTEEDDLLIKMRRTKTLLVENYKDRPWKKEASKAE